MNPYHQQEPGIETATDLFGNYRVIPTKKRQSERGELLRYFARKLNLDEKDDIGFVAMKVTRLNLDDLYYIKSAADSYEREGKGPWGKAFYGMLKPKL